MKDLHHSGASANISYYAEPTSNHGDVWAEVLRSDQYYTGSGKRRVAHNRRAPKFWISVRRIGSGTVAERAYVPRSPVPPGPLDDATVTRLVRAALKET